MVLVMLLVVSVSGVPEAWKWGGHGIWIIMVAVPLGLLGAVLYLMEWINHARLATSLCVEAGRLTWRRPGFRGMRVSTWSADTVARVEAQNEGRLVSNWRARVGRLEIRFRHRWVVTTFEGCDLGELTQVADELRLRLWGAIEAAADKPT